ncbi:MAG: SGNH/GDSL hydrolase family protein [Firmicutes bacterium]|nr:SGNH/GDSL hydrolase family protein [Bacillota bacterium]
MNINHRQPKKIILLGDSITQGLGSKKINFTQHLQELLGDQYTVENMALTGTTICYTATIFDQIIHSDPDYIVVLYGNVDAQIRPCRTGKLFAHIPSRFQGNGMLSPRPFYSHKVAVRAMQKIENFIRFCLNRTIRKIDGTEQLVSISDFKQTYDEFIQRCNCNDIKLLLSSTVFIDDRKFPGSLAQYREFNAVIKHLSDDNGLMYIDIFTALKVAVETNGWSGIYCYDHFHPAEKGYFILSEKISEGIKACEMEMHTSK